MQDGTPAMSILNPEPKKIPGAMLLHHLVRPASDDVALEHLSHGKITSVSYTALHDASNALASRIVASIAPEQGQDRVQNHGQLVVPVLLHQSPVLYIAVLAILKAGAAFCPLNLDAPPERISFIMKDVCARVVVSSPEFSAKLPQNAGLVVLDPSEQNRSDDSSPTVHRQSHGVVSPPIQPLPDSVAYVMYTSGSTGTPKGISITHFAASQALLAHDSHIPCFSRFLQFAAPTFDVSVFEIFFPLFRGSTLISAQKQETLDNLSAVLRRMDVDACELTPTVAMSLLRKRESAPRLKLLLTIGEMLNPRVVEEFGGSLGRESMLWAMYGPTEATIHCTLQARFQASSSTGNIGKPLETVSCFIIREAIDELDARNFEILAVGKVGELAVGGHQLAVGYLNNEKKTSAAFIDSPYGRVYRTGDKAKMNTDGTIECLGRITEGQVKLRGQRIELGEIEHAILKAQGCLGASVRVIGKTLVGFCAVEKFVSENQILDSCRAWLPQFMVPGQVVLMPELPRLPSGKVDTKELERFFTNLKEQQLMNESDEIPVNTDPKLARILRDAFGPHLSMQTDLTSVGLDSLSSISLSSETRLAGYNMSATDVLKARTVGQLLTMAAEAEGVDCNSPAVSISLVEKLPLIETPEMVQEQKIRKIQDILPCTELQMGMLFESLRSPSVYWNTAELELYTTVSTDQIIEAIYRVIEKNEILRTGFIQQNSTFYSVIFDNINSSCIMSGHQPNKHTFQASLLCPLQLHIDQAAKATLTRVRLHLHHSIYDGWSLDLFKSDLSRAVQQQLIPLRVQFRDVVAFFASSECNKLDEKAKVFWADYLFGWNKPPFPRLTSKLPKVASIGTAKLMHTLPPAITTGLNYNRESAQVQFQAALALVWAGVLGLQDVVIGLVTSGRTIPVKGIESVMGPCISSLPHRVNMESMETTSDLLNNVKTSNRHLMEHSTLSQPSIKRLVNMYGTEPLYDVLFVFQDSLEQRRQTNCIVKETAHLDKLETKLLIQVQPVNGNNFLLQATFHQEFISPGLAEILLHQIAALSSAFATRPQESLQSASQVLKANLSTYNLSLDKMKRPTGPDNLVSIVQEAVLRYPNRTAISFAKEISSTSSFVPKSISYNDLNRSSNRIGHFLQSQRVVAGGVIAVIMRKSILLYTTILAILKAGHGYLPLLPSTPRARINEILEQSKCGLCLVDEASLTVDSATNGSVRIVLIDEKSMTKFPDTNISVQIKASQVAYVIYTSGTTGTPKGVAVSQSNIARNITYLGNEYPEAVSRPSKLLQACSQAFDVSVFEIFFAWHKGMCLCVAPNDVLFADIEEAIRKFEITHLSLTPTIASLIDPKKVPTVGFLVTAGEPMTKAVHARWNGLLWQGYGPSETTNICSVKKMASDDLIEHLGFVFDNTSVLVLQPNKLSVAPIGWAGELCFGGEQVANGYLNMPRLTTEKFIQYPEVHGRVYRSGDFGRMLPDGSLVILGRIDEQLKLRGQRIEASEVNNVIFAAFSATAAVTLVLSQKESCGDRLVTFFVNGAETQRSDFQVFKPDPSLQRLLFAELQTRLPSYMVPSYVIPVSRIPLTTSGKVDKRAIYAAFLQLEKGYLETAMYSVTRDDDEEWTREEESLAKVVAEALDVQVADLNRWTPLAVLGLDSISAIKVSKRLGERLGVGVPISTILQGPTVAQLAKVLESSRLQRKTLSPETSHQCFDEQLLNSIRSTLAQKGHSASDILPCLPLQEAMVSRGKTSYYNKSLLRLHGSVHDMRVLWQHMCERHSILRTCFVSTDSAEYPVAQVVLSKWTLPWHEIVVKHLSFDDALQRHLDLAPAPLNTYTPPLSLAVIQQRDSSFLSFLCHHALYDGVAISRLWQEIETLARGELLPPVVSYSAFLHDALRLPQDNKSFWTRQFTGFQPVTLFPGFNIETMEQVTHSFTVDCALNGVQYRIRTLGLSLLSVCQASMTRVLATISKKKDVCFGNVMSGRTTSIDCIERLVAPCFNTVPVRQEIPDSMSNVALAKSLLHLNTELLRHQFTPLRKVQQIISAGARISLFDALLLVQQPVEELDEQVLTLEQDSGIMDLPLVCEFTPCPGMNSLVLNVHHDMSVVSSDLATGIAELFKYFFSQILGLPHATMSAGRIPKHLIDQIGDHQASLPKIEEKFDYIVNGDELWSKEQVDVRNIFSKLSKVSRRRISHGTSFFRLGLDSINAVQVASLLRQKQYVITASDVIECQNCFHIAQRILKNELKSEKECPEYAFEAFEAEIWPVLHGISATCPILPCTPMQCAMLSSFVSSKGVNYLNGVSLEMDEGIDLSMVSSKFAELVAGHVMLRTGFVPVRHADCTYAMVQHEEFSASQNITFASQVTDREDWRRTAARDILARLRIPPWRLFVTIKKAKVLFYLVIHHALYDAFSLQRILSNLANILTKTKIKTSNNIRPGLSAVLQRSLRNTEDAAKFWREAGEHAAINKFPVLTPLKEANRQTLLEETTASISFSCLQELVKAADISVQAVILATWTRLLAAYTGEESVVFGITLSGRTCESTLDTPIPCLTTVPVVVKNQASNRELLDQMRRWVSQVHQHQYLPLNRIQKEMGHAASAVFDTLIVYQKMEMALDGERRPWVQLEDDATVEFPVSLEVEQASDGTDDIYLRLTYWSDIMPCQQAEILLSQFEACLKCLASSPDGSQEDVPKLYREICSLSPPLEPVIKAPVEFLHQFVEIQARLNPDKLALEYVSGFSEHRGATSGINSTRWTYSQLNSMGNKVANLLYSRNIPAGSIIAIHFDKQPEAYFAILGILKSGSAFVALDINAPGARKEFIIRDSSSPCLLTSSDDATMLDFDVACPVIMLGKDVLSDYPDTACAVDKALSPDSTCYCLYTSGTTGTPKGCEITHENTVQCMMAFQDIFSGHWSDESRCLQFAALHFDVSVLEQYWSWSVGIAVIAAKKDLILNNLVGFINKLDITHIDLTPSLARLVDPDTVPSLCRGVFITGGEPLKKEILDAWGPKAVIYNAYGPTEATIGVTTYRRVPQNGRSSNIGQPFRNVGAYVLTRDTDIPVLRGAVGELCVSGKLVGKGYLNRVELTKARFPTLPSLGARVYRTGDLVRMLHDGSLDFLGRADDQVKLRGQRLELGEIDHVICSFTGVQNVATMITKHPWSHKDVLVSFWVQAGEVREGENGAAVLKILEDTGGVGVAARKACREKLPGYMVPSYFLRLSYIPLSSNNKAEAKQLRHVFSELSQKDLARFSSAAMSQRKTGVIAIGSDCMILLNLLSEFCGVERESLSEESSIFDYGIDSITALQFSSFLIDKGLANASPAVIIRNPILADLAAALLDNNHGAETMYDASAELKQTRQTVRACAHRNMARICRDLGISIADIEYLYPCSPLQQGMLAQTEIEILSYFNTFKLCLTAETSVRNLKDAFRAIFIAEPVLRTWFAHTPDGNVQVARRDLDLPWEERILSGKETLDDVTGSVRQEWIDANRSRLRQPLKIVFISDHDGNRLVIVHIFHGLYDGVSFDLMMAKLARLYEGKDVAAPGPPFTEALIHGPLRHHERFKLQWMEHLREWKLAALLFPLRDTETSKPEFAVCAWRTLNHTRFDRLRSLRNVTMQSVLLSAWTCALMQNCRIGHITTGVIVSGRSIRMEGAESVIGPLFNTVPFFVKLGPEARWETVLARCQDFQAMVFNDPHVPLQNIQKWVSGGKPLFDNLFVYQTMNVEAAVPDRTVPWVVEDGGGLYSNYPLALEVSKKADGHLGLLLVARSSVASESQLAQLLDGFEDMLRSMEMASEIPIQSDMEPSNYSSLTVQEHVKDEKEADWKAHATVLRREVAALAHVAESDVKPSTTWVELGLDSIDAVQLSARLQKHMLLLSPSAVIKSRCMDEMADALQVPCDEEKCGVESNSLAESLKHRLGDAVQALGLDLSDIENLLPTTPLQDAMVSGMIESDFDYYFNHEILQVAPGIDSDRLQTAWMKVLEASPILRTGFLEVPDAELSAVYAQVVYKAAPAICVETVKSMSELRGIMIRNTEEARRNSARSGLAHVVRATLSGEEQRTFFVLSISHALYDGWSLGLLYEDLRAAYDGGEIKQRPAPDEFLFRSADSSLTVEAQSFWKSYLGGARPTIFDTVSLPSKSGGGLNTIVKKLERRSRTSMHDVHVFCKTHSISLQALCQACWAVILARKTQSLDVVFGTVLSGRDFAGAQDLLFPTMNTVAFRCVLHGTVSSFLQYVEENIGDVRSYQMFPLRRAKAISAAGARVDLFNSLFMLQKTSWPSNAQTLTLFEAIDGSAHVDYPVCVEAAADECFLQWTVACRSRPEEAASLADELISELDRTLEYLVEHSEHELVLFSARGVEICASEPIRLTDEEEEEEEKQDGCSQAISSQSQSHEWTVTSLAIRKILSQVSHVPEDSIEPTSTLYHLGLDSITAIKVSSLLKQEGIFLRPTELVGAASITQMAHIVSPINSSLGSSSANSDGDESGQDWTLWKPPIQADIGAFLEAAGLSMAHVEHILPALPMQVYMMSAWENSIHTGRCGDEGIVFYPEFAYRYCGPHSVSDIRQAWRIVRRRLPMLRTCLVPTGLVELPFVQVVLKLDDEVAVNTSVILGNNEEDDAAGPLVHFEVRETAVASQKHLRLRIHHALYDGVSLPATMDAMLVTLREGVGNPPSLGNTVPLSMDLWARDLCAAQTDARRAHRRAFWTRYFSGCRNNLPKKDVYTLASEGQQKQHSRTSHFEKAALSNSDFLTEKASACGVSVQSLVLAAYALTVASRQGYERQISVNGEDVNGGVVDIVFGVYLASRLDEGVPDTLPTLRLVPQWVSLKREEIITTTTTKSALPKNAAEVTVRVACRIHADMQRIRADDVAAQVGLWEIARWAGVKVDKFVNFLTLPRGSSWSADVDDLRRGMAQLTSIPVSEAMGDGLPLLPPRPSLIRKNVVRDDYPDSVDVEFSIRHRHLDVGVFGPPCLVTDEEALGLIDGIVQCLKVFETT